MTIVDYYYFVLLKCETFDAEKFASISPVYSIFVRKFCNVSKKLKDYFSRQ